MKNNDHFKIDDEMREIVDNYRKNASIDQKKEATLVILKEYLPVQNRVPVVKTAFHLLNMALKELFAISKLHYGVFIILVLGLFPVVDMMTDPYLMIFFTAPIPLIIGYWNIFGRGHEVMTDLEKTFKYSYNQVICSKIIVITGVSIVFLSLPLTYLFLIDVHLGSLSVFKLVIWGLVPIFTFAVLLLFIVTMNRHDHVLTIALLIWGVFGFATISTPIGEILLNAQLFVYLLLNTISITLLIVKMSHMLSGKRRSYII